MAEETDLSLPESEQNIKGFLSSSQDLRPSSKASSEQIKILVFKVLSAL